MSRVLLIDDNLDMQKMLSVVLRKQGHEVVSADRGQMGIDLALNQTFDVVVLDVMMPDMNGYDVARRLRAESRSAATPIIILTARAQPVDQQAALEAGADIYLSKPVDIAELNSKIQELSAVGRPKPPQPAQPPPVTPSSTAPPAAAPAITPAPATDPFAAPAPPPPPPPPPVGRILSVLSWRGGVGATTLAVNLAGILLREGRRVCLIDLSPVSGHVALMLRLRAKPNWADLPAEVSAQHLGFSLLKHESGLQMLASPAQPQAEGLSAEKFNAVTQIMFHFFTDIVVDCSPVLDAATRCALLAAKRILAPFASEVAAVQTLTGTLGALGALPVSPAQLAIILNHPTPNPTLLAARIERAIGRAIDATLPYDPAQSAALLQGAPLFISQPRSPYITALMSLVPRL